MSVGCRPFHVPSRLKGIETISLGSKSTSASTSTFHVPSRLKGIETCVFLRFCLRALFGLAFHVPSRLKGIETSAGVGDAGSSSRTFHVPSRLKGIETSSLWRVCERGLIFPCTFPFEGNWNYTTSLMYTVSTPTSFHVPSRLKGIETVYMAPLFISLWFSAFHVPSRLKGIETGYFPILILVRSDSFPCTFPFEGNWNAVSRCVRFLVLCFPCTFPFEGNWNPSSHATFGIQVCDWLSMYLPVWRELKLNFIRTPQFVYYFTTFHVPSRLKGIETVGLSIGLVCILGYLSMYLPVWRELKL